MDYTHHKYLDDLLDYIITKENDNVNIRTSFMPPDDLGGLRYEKLIRDKYIAQYGQDYRATIEGRLFFERGGYVQEQINLANESQRILKLEKNTYRAAVCVAIATIALVLFEVWKIYHHLTWE
jgi:hypothetical protein